MADLDVQQTHLSFYRLLLRSLGLGFLGNILLVRKNLARFSDTWCNLAPRIPLSPWPSGSFLGVWLLLQLKTLGFVLIALLRY